jgi:hypothetical protein
MRFLVLCLVSGLATIYLVPRSRVLGLSWMIVVAIGYVGLSLPWTANALANGLPRSTPSDSWRPLDTEIVLAGDNRVGRVRQAEEVFSSAAPSGVWVLGDAQFLDSVVENGIPRARIKPVFGTRTTRDQMMRVRSLVAAGRLGRTAIIASRLQMPRVAALARALNLDVVLIGSPVDAEPPTAGPWDLVPSYDALRVSEDTLYEHAALAYYSWRGWTN